MKSLRSKSVLGISVAAGAVITLIMWWASPQDGTLSQHDAPTSRPVMRNIRLLLRAEVDDETNWEKRNGYIGSHITGLADRAVWERRFPVRYAREQILLFGHDAIDPLMEVVTDATENKRIQRVAWRVLVDFDDVRIRGQLLSALKAGKLTWLDTGWLLSKHLPIERASPVLAEDRIVAWLEENQQRDYDELCLSLLDDLMKSEKTISYYSLRMPRWLNRMHDQDLDQWLETNAPDAFAFRNRELARGYDPIAAFDRLRYNLSAGVLDEGINAVFTDKQTQTACHHLLDATEGYGVSPIGVPRASGWEKRALDWYTRHRSQLKYDRGKHRFTIEASSGVIGR